MNADEWMVFINSYLYEEQVTQTDDIEAPMKTVLIELHVYLEMTTGCKLRHQIKRRQIAVNLRCS